MNAEWIRSGLDLLLIVMVGVGLLQAARLIKHLAGLQQGRVDMERFVHEFNAVVVRAEMGIKNLKQVARDSGDDLEKLVEKSISIRDELAFIVESADQLAERLTTVASSTMRAEVRPEPRAEKQPEPVIEAARSAPIEPPPPAVTPMKGRKAEAPPPSSRAEKELLQALQKLK